MINGRSYPGIPTLVWPDGIDEIASDWLRDLVVRRGLAISSAEEYAKIIRPFLRFCRHKKKAWNTVDDGFLLTWRKELQNSKKADIARINSSINTIFSLYRWAEEENRIRFHVGIYSEDELPAGLRDHQFSITAQKNFRKTRNGLVLGAWSSTLTLAGANQGSRLRNTPNEEEIRRLHGVVVEGALGERNSLLLSWAEEVGTRRAEMLQVRKSDMPTAQQLAEVLENNEKWRVDLRRKGGATKPVYVPPDLIIRTIDFIDFERSEIVCRLREKNAHYVEPDEVFLSSTTGLVLHPDSVTSLAGLAFAQSGIENANIHRLRARKLVVVIETLVEALFDDKLIGANSNWIETILTMASEAMGHMSPNSLRPYLNFVLKRRISTADSFRIADLETRRRQLRAHVSTLERRLSRNAAFQNVLLRIEDGETATAASLLRQLADELTSSP